MALSDACFEFLEAVEAAARELAESVHWYSAPDYPLPYGEEIDALRRACLAVAASSYDAEAGIQLLRLATSVMRYHDAPPVPPGSLDHRAKVRTLVKLLQSGVDVLDASAVPSVVEHVLCETPLTKRAADRLKAMLSALAQSDRDMVVDIVSDVGSATAKNALELDGRTAVGRKVQADICILTIKEEELEAVLEAFPTGSDVYVSPTTYRQYNLRVAEACDGTMYQLAILRQPEQGNGEAQSATRDMIEDLSPRLILVVGIAGALPSRESTLGDVILSLRIHDYTVEARQEGEESTYAMGGGPVGRQVESHVANLRARVKDLGSWTEGLPGRPPVVLEDLNFYGPEEWRKEVRESLEHHFTSKTRPPRFFSGVIASSDRLIKETRVLIPWLQTTRHLLAVEMESGGVYRAARERCAMLAIRGVSDVIGFSRDERWTRYACASAAAFARAYLRTRPIEARSPSRGSSSNVGL